MLGNYGLQAVSNERSLLLTTGSFSTKRRSGTTWKESVRRVCWAQREGNESHPDGLYRS